MNKQELIEKVIENGAWCTENHTGEIDRYVKITKVRELIGSLEKQQKPVVPQFVADWFEEHKDDLEYNIWDLCVDSFNSTKGGMYSWVNVGEKKTNRNTNQNETIRI